MKQNSRTNMKSITRTSVALFAIVAMTVGAFNSRANNFSAPAASLPDAGQKLQDRYSAMLAELKAEIIRAIPNLPEQKKAAFVQARDAEKAAEAAVNTSLKNLGTVGTAQALVGHAKGKWIGGADKGIAAAQAKLKNATTAAELAAAQKELADWQQNRAEGVAALNERQKNLDRAKLEEAQFRKNLEAAQNALTQAKAKSLEALRDLKLDSALKTDKLDAKLAKFVIISETTSTGMAKFAQQSQSHEQLIESLLSNNELMLQMVEADGAKGGNYPRAMQIYTDIQKASAKASSTASGGALQRLAVAISLEHAVPIRQQNRAVDTTAPATVDPVARYLHYEEAFLKGELDAGFRNLSVWNYRMVVDGEEPDEILAWGRQMLRNYRPDHVTTGDYRWRYVALVGSDIKYGSQDNQYDKPELHNYQNILMNGGICGRRAFFGRFLLRAFGIPTIARPQTGHAALAHWTPNGWVVCLGADWGGGFVRGEGGKRVPDLDFLAISQARVVKDSFMQVKRAQWIGDVMGESRAFGLLSSTPAFWNSVALYLQRAIIIDAKSVTLAAVGEDIGEANESKVKEKIQAAKLAADDKKVSVGAGGVIKIPAAATSKPTNSTRKIVFLPSNLGGMQLHYNRNGGHEPFEYTFDAPAAGKYALTSRVVTPSWRQSLLLSVNGAKDAINIDLPFTVGMWEETSPIEVTLVKGQNVLRFSREGDVKGVSIKDFTLTPVK